MNAKQTRNEISGSVVVRGKELVFVEPVRKVKFALLSALRFCPRHEMAHDGVLRRALVPYHGEEVVNVEIHVVVNFKEERRVAKVAQKMFHRKSGLQSQIQVHVVEVLKNDVVEQHRLADD